MATGKILRLSCLVLLFCACAGAARAADTCSALKPFKTQIDVNLTVADPVYNLAMSWDELNKKEVQTRKDWLAKNGLQELWSADDLKTAGTASGGWAASYGYEVQPVRVDQYGVYYCPFFSRVTIDLFYRTIISIPRDFPPDSCTFNVVREHELMHHEANKKAVTMYVDRLRQDLVPIVAQLEEGYTGHDQIEDRYAQMKQGMADAVQIYFQEATAAKMNELNGLIDTPKEYALRSEMMDRCRQPGQAQ